MEIVRYHDGQNRGAAVIRDGNALDRLKFYEEQASYCARLLEQIKDPRRRGILDRERQDWLALAEQRRRRVEGLQEASAA